MREHRNSLISESEDSDEESQSAKPSTSNITQLNNRSSSSSDSSSEEETRAPTPPPAPKRSFSTSPKKKVHGNPLERFISENPKLVKLKVDDVISEDEEVCLLEVPKIIDPTHLVEKVINFDKRTKVKLNKIRYLIEPTYEDVTPINLLTDKLKIIHPLTVLKMRENTKHKHDSEAVEFETIIPSLPDNLKVRHPLFGSQYKPKIVLNEEIQKKLDSAIDTAFEKMKKKKHKKDKRVSSTQASDLGKKKKKHKREEVDEESGFATETDHELNDNSQVEESIFALLESHISGKKKKIHKNSTKEEFAEQEHNEQNESVGNISETGKEHKKKKDKSREAAEVTSKLSASFSSDAFEEKHKKKKKHRINLKEEKVTSNDSSNFSLDVQSEDSDNELSKSGRRKLKNNHQSSVTKGKINLSTEEKKKHKINVKEEKFPSNDCEEEDGGKKRKHKNSIRKENTDEDVNAEDLENELSKSEKRKYKDSVRDFAAFMESEDPASIKIIKKNQSSVTKGKINLSTEEKKKQKVNVKEEKCTSNVSEEEDVGNKGKHKNSIREENTDEDENADLVKELHKSEKRKHKDSVRDIATFLEPQDHSFVKIKIEKKNKRTSIANSTVIPGLQLPLFEFDVSGIVNKEADLESSKNEEDSIEDSLQKHKKKRDDKSLLKKSINESDSTQVANESLGSRMKKKSKRDDDHDSVSPRKKIKKEKVEEKEDEMTNSLILDLLNKVKSEMDTSAVHKKKRKSDR